MALRVLSFIHIMENDLYDEFLEDLINLDWRFDPIFDRCFLLPDTYNKMFDKLSYLRRNKLIDQQHRQVFFSLIKLGATRYKEYIIKLENKPRLEAQKFIGKRNIRDFIFKRDNYKCLCCGSKEKLSIDHIKSVYDGGENKISNLQTLCGSCNSRKSNNYKDYRNGSR